MATWRFDLILFGLTTFMSHQVALAQVTISQSPQNVAVLTGATVELQCTMDQSDTFTQVLAWEECITLSEGGCLRVTSDDAVQYVAQGGDPTRATRYYVNRTSTGGNQFNFYIKEVKMNEDAGRYRCISINNPDQVGDAEVVIIGSQTTCSGNTSLVADPNEDVTGQTISIQCEVRYSGNLEPKIEFLKEDSAKESNETLPATRDATLSTGDKVVYSMSRTIQNGDGGSVLRARTFFEAPAEMDNKAKNAPDYVRYNNFGTIPGTTGAGHTLRCWTLLPVLLATLSSSWHIS